MPHFRFHYLLLACLLLKASGGMEAQTPTATSATPSGATTGGHALPSPAVTAAPVGGSINLDGRLDEAIWSTVEPATNFRQRQPDDGQPATQRTEVRFLYDGDAIYVGAKMFDTEGGAGVRTRLVRRDQSTNSDWIEITLDTWHNHVGRTVFAVNPSGVRRDAGQASEFADPSWDPVWEAKVAIDDEGWTAEFRIPLSQLRFQPDSLQTWGLQITRTALRLNEISVWSHWTLTEVGGPPRYGHLHDLKLQQDTRRLELMPYTVGRAQFLRAGNPADPFYDRTPRDSRVGVDLRYLVTPSLTLDATINPDFGQVEVDPAVVNLSAFEVFFPERRPFFIEGGGIFGFGGFNCFFCSNVSSMSLLHTRRIGRTPQGSLPSGTDFSDRPDATSILGAAKLTGRIGGGYTIGVMNAVTGRESARFQRDETIGTHEVEPLTNYFVGRVKRDAAQGNLVIGAMGTSVTRFTDQPTLKELLPQHAEAFGVDWQARWKDRRYSFMGNLAATNVTGEPAAIERLQRSSARFFQRPDRQNGGNGLFSDAFDPSLTSLRGLGGYSRIAKEAGDWLWESAINFRTPGFEANDLAFLTRADYFWMNANLIRTFQQPTSWYRNLDLVTGGQQQYNFDGDLTDRQFQLFAGITFLNYWNINTFAIRRLTVNDDRLSRGGPVLKQPGSWFYNLNINTDNRRKLVFNINPNFTFGDEGNTSFNVSTNVRIRPAPNLDISVAPFYRRQTGTQQFVTAVADPTAADFFGTRYIFSDLDQRSLGFDTRMNLTFTPNLSLELFAQPFASSVDFSQFKEFTTTRTTAKQVFGRDVGSITPITNAAGQTTGYTIDPDASGAAQQFTVSNPDFRLQSLRGNAVLRWEYRPGSTIFLVWTRTGTETLPFTSGLSLNRELNGIFSAESDNVFMVKFTYWINR